MDTSAASYPPDSLAALLGLLGVDRASVEALERAGVTSLDVAVRLGTADLAAMGLRLLARDRVLRAVSKARSYAVRQAASTEDPRATSRAAPWSAGMERQRPKPSFDAEGRRLTRWRGLVFVASAAASPAASPAASRAPERSTPALAKADEAVIGNEAVTGDEALTGADKQAEAVDDGMRVDSVFCPISASASPHFIRPNQT